MASESTSSSGGNGSGPGSGYVPSSSTAFMVLLTSDNYHTWRTKMEDYLYCQKLWQPIHYEGVKPDTIKTDEWAITDRICLGMVRRFVDDTVLNYIAEETAAYGAWKTLKDTYGSSSANNKVLALRTFVYSKYVDGTSMSEHLNKLKGIINQLNQMEVGLKDDLHALLILITLPDSWGALSSALGSVSTSGTKLSVKSVTATLLEEELRRKNSMSTFSSNADTVATAERRRKGRKQNKDLLCDYCGKVGHKQGDCWTYQKDKRNGTVKDKKPQVNVAEDLILVEDCNCSKPDCGVLQDLI